jgi:predicted DNA-binding transcriptional regulator YafY
MPGMAISSLAEEKEEFAGLAESIGELISVVVRLTPHGADLISDYPLTPTQVFQFQANGDAIIRCQNVGFRDALHWVLSWGQEAEVIEPEHLREEVASHLRNALHNHLQRKIGELTAERDFLARGLQL